MKIVKHEGDVFWAEAVYEKFRMEHENINPDWRFSRLIEENNIFITSQNVKIFRRPTLNKESIVYRYQFQGRYKTEDEKYTDCLEFMIEKLS